MSPPLSDDQRARVESHAELVTRIARRLKRRLPVLSFDELESIGNEALVQAAMRYDPKSAASFSTFAHYRIHGAMIDAARKRTPARRKQKRALLRLERTQALLSEAAHDREARRATGGRQSLEHKIETARELVRRAALAVQLSEPVGAGVDRAASASPDPEQLLLHADARRRMWDLVAQLGEEERGIIEGIYVHGRTMKELAEEAGVSNATMSRRHARILDRLAARVRSQDRRSVG